MSQVSAELAKAALADRGDGELTLSLDTIYDADSSPWMTPAYRFDMRVEGERAGTISLRVGDDERLVRYAGHVGYAVDETWRGRRLAERAVRLLVPLAKAHGLDPLWIGCNPDNLASRRTLERLGAVFVETAPLPPDYVRYYSRGEREKRRYRLDLGSGGSKSEAPPLGAPVLHPAAPADAPALARFAAESFVETFVRGFAIPYAEADLQAYLAEACAPEVFARAIADPRCDVRLLADHAGLAAYALSGPPGLPHPEVQPQDAEIKRFYIRPDLQGTGLAQAALVELLGDLDPHGGRRLWLSVWSGNARAQRFYARHGFRPDGEWDYPVGRHIDLDYIYRRG